MSVPPQHRESLVTGDGSDLHRVEALLEKSARRLMPEIVKTYILELRAVSCPTERIFHRFCGKGENATIEGARQRGQRRDSPRGKRNVSRCTVFCVG